MRLTLTQIPNELSLELQRSDIPPFLPDAIIITNIGLRIVWLRVESAGTILINDAWTTGQTHTYFLLDFPLANLSVSHIISSGVYG